MNLLPGLLLLLGITASITDAQDIRIIPERESVIKPIGESLVFQCVVENAGQDPQLMWFDQQNQEINDRTGRKYIEDDGREMLKLYILKIVADDAGKYSCRGRVNNSPVEAQIDLMLYQDITFDHAPSIQYPAIYTNAIIECRVSGQPSPTVSWRYDDIKVVDGGRYSYITEGLRINNITEADNGLYSCRAEVATEGRFDSRPITVEVHIPPTITEQLGDNEGVEGQEATISCRSSAKPDAKYEFYRGTSEAPMSSTDRIIVDGDGGTVSFRPLHKDDENDYICKAVNDVGFAESTGYLNVVVPPRIVRLENTTALEGTTGELICVSEGDPAPIMTFQKAGEAPYAAGENEGGRIIVETTSDNNLKLTINNLRPSDTHNYTCRTENKGGTFFKNGTIGVQFAPRFADDHVTQYYNWAGRRRNMTCYAEGEPEPNVNWVRYNTILQNNETYIVYKEGRTSKLQVYVQDGDQSWIYGDYQCRAENDHGLKELDITLKRATVPGRPEGVELMDSSPTMVTLAVQPPEEDGGMAVTAYRIEYDGFSTEFALGDLIKLENLQPTTTYIFNIRARNEVGVGIPLEHSITTESIRVPYPIVLTSDPEGAYPYSYVLRWETPRTGGLDIREYQFMYRRVSVNDGTYDIRKPETDYTKITVHDDYRRPMRTYTLSELKPSSYYQIEVTARNDLGWSTPNPEFVFSTAEGYGGKTGEVGSGADGLQAYFVISTFLCLLAAFL